MVGNPAGAPAAGRAGMTAAVSGSGGGLANAGRTATAGQNSVAGAPPTAAGSGATAAVGGAGSGGMIANAGSGGVPATAGGPAAGSGSIDMLDCGTGGTIGKASNAGGVQGRGNGNVQFTLSAGNQILRLRTTLEVPVKPNGTQTMFLWPGLEPLQGENYNPIGTGVLQPVLTWGGSCAPGSPQTRTGSSWWISAQYVNTLTSDAMFKGCKGGPIMNVEVGDQLLIDMSLNGTSWNQTVTNQSNRKSVDFDIDMMKQPQRWALFEIEMPTTTKPASDVVFTNTVMTFAKPEAKACQPTARGADDYFSAPVASTDGLRCCVSRIVLRVQGATHTTMDP
jgi:hypothetical protein